MDSVSVGTEIRQSIDRLGAEFPDVRVVDLTGELGADEKVDVLFGGWGSNAIEVVQRGARWVQLSGTGWDRVPKEILDAPLVTCARGASAVPISEFVLASMLAFEKDFPANWLTAPPKTWNFQRMDALAGKTLGLVGLGGIGTRVARLALAFEMDVVALRRHPELGSPVPGVRVSGSIDEILPVADHLVLAAPATARTRHLLDAAAFGRMKPGAHLVNIARGTLVDQDALKDALESGVVARASLDTVDPEPLPEGHWMYSHPNVRLTPHSSWSSHAFFDAAIDIFFDNLRRFIAGDDLIYLIDREEGY
jgi:phosphoglycerate dehydrogenase-like enzyme